MHVLGGDSASVRELGAPLFVWSLDTRATKDVARKKRDPKAVQGFKIMVKKLEPYVRWGPCNGVSPFTGRDRSCLLPRDLLLEPPNFTSPMLTIRNHPVIKCMFRAVSAVCRILIACVSQD